jgi:hypothetical protein
MRRSLLAVFLFAAGACVDVPSGIRAQFAGPAAGDRSNYRPGRHGSALPPEEDGQRVDAGVGPVAKAAEVAATGAVLESKADGGALEPGTVLSADGGAP